MWDLCVPMRVTFPGRTLPFLIVRGTVVHRLSSSVRPRARVLSLARLQVPFVPKYDQYILLLYISLSYSQWRRGEKVDDAFSGFNVGYEGNFASVA